MYTEELRMSTRAMLLLAIPFAVTVAVLAALLVLLPLPRAGWFLLLGALLLEAAVGALLVTTLSRMRLSIEGHTLTIAFRLFITKRIALERIVRCTPTDARVWGISYHRDSLNWGYRGHGGPRRAVMLRLTNGAQVLFRSRHPDAVCAALRARRPEIG